MLTFNTTSLDVSVALNAIKHYQAGNYKQAIDSLQLVLDCEPENWDARLMLGACFYKSGQYVSAHRVFQFLCDKTNNLEIRRKAAEGVQACTAKMDNRHSMPGDIPAEFGCYVEFSGVRQAKAMSWL
ncbi:MAG: tetratricopeptide repeat protein [Candidatus Obscuribacterales bacterium]|nr:tetratricopeptide repeat protein [Candidatus Obscuribacterales bacterium]